MPGRVYVVPESAHAKYSPSSASRWVICGASVLSLPPDNPVPDSNAFALEGSAAHWILEQTLMDWPGCYTERHPETPTPGDLVQFGTSKVPITQDMFDHAEAVLDELIEWCPDFLLAEQKVYPHTPLREVLFGTADVIAMRGTQLLIADYKYGVGVVVEPEHNLQLLLYARGAYEDYAKPFDAEITEIELAIAQPRAPHADGWFRSCTMALDEMLQVTDTIIKRILQYETDSREPVRIPGGWCRWCPRAVLCDELEALVIRKLGRA